MAAVVEWERGTPAFELAYMPGDGTHYGLLFTVGSWRVLGAGGGGTRGDRATTAAGFRLDGHYASVTYLQKGHAFAFGRRDFVHPSTLAGSLPDTTPGSILALCVLLNEITGAAPGWESRMVEAAP